MSLANSIQQGSDEAGESGFAPVNYGKLIVTPYIIKWEGEKGAKKKIEREMMEGDVVGKGEMLELLFITKISELNENIDFDYERRVTVVNSGRNLTDWGEITLPSLIKVFGDDWAEAVMKQPYIEVTGEDNVKGNASKSGKVYDAPNFIQVFADKAACIAARDERFGGNNASGPASAMTPDGIPVDVVAQAKSLIGSVGGVETARPMLEQNAPFNNHDIDKLIEAATA